MLSLLTVFQLASGLKALLLAFLRAIPTVLFYVLSFLFYLSCLLFFFLLLLSFYVLFIYSQTLTVRSRWNSSALSCGCVMGVNMGLHWVLLLFQLLGFIKALYGFYHYLKMRTGTTPNPNIKYEVNWNSVFYLDAKSRKCKSVWLAQSGKNVASA